MTPDTKTRRVRAVLDLLDHAECSVSEILQRLHLPEGKRRSVQRDVADLIDQGDVEPCGPDRYRRVRRAHQLNPVEALAVYSAARMLFHHASEYNEHYLRALEKLAQDLPERARKVALQANEVYKARRGARSSLVFEVAAQAWMNGQVLSCTYHSQRRATKLELEIYFIEVNARNREAYAIGVNRLRPDAQLQPYVYRLARMKQPTLTAATYAVPDDFHPLRFLSSAWGIMTGEPQRVELFFTPAVRERVEETYFGHLAEPALTLSTGQTRVVLTVGNWLELVPWILGWGAEVEVLGPPELRAHVAGVVHAASALYGPPASAQGAALQVTHG